MSIISEAIGKHWFIELLSLQIRKNSVLERLNRSVLKIAKSCLFGTAKFEKEKHLISSDFFTTNGELKNIFRVISLFKMSKMGNLTNEIRNHCFSTWEISNSKKHIFLDSRHQVYLWKIHVFAHPTKVITNFHWCSI